MPRIVIIWHDVDHTRTAHQFASAEEAEVWLRSVLEEHCPQDEVEAGGYEATGLGMLSYYTTEGLDDVGSIEVYIDGMGVGPEALNE